MERVAVSPVSGEGVGVLIDVADARGELEFLEGYRNRARDLEQAVRRPGTERHKGDVILVRTVDRSRCPDLIDTSCKAPGVVLDEARLLAEASPIAVGSDTSGFETEEAENGWPNNVHIHLSIESASHITEWLSLEELARAAVYDFLFIALPLKIQATTGSWIRPVCELISRHLAVGSAWEYTHTCASQEKGRDSVGH
jgi:kynurenine formamidase